MFKGIKGFHDIVWSLTAVLSLCAKFCIDTEVDYIIRWYYEMQQENI